MLRTRLSLVATAVSALVLSTLSVVALSTPAQADPTPLGLEPGDLVVSDPGHHQLVVHPADGGPDRYITGVSNPQGLVVTKAGDIIVIDSGNSTIQKFAADGTQSTLASRSGIGYLALDRTDTYVYYSGPGFGGVGRMKLSDGSRNDNYIPGTNFAGLAVDASGDVVGARTDNHVVRIHGSGGSATMTTVPEVSYEGSSFPDCFTVPRPCNQSGLALTPDDRIVVADTVNDEIWESDGAGGAGHYGSGLNEPTGVAVGRDDTVYVADMLNGRVVAISVNRAVQTDVVTGLLSPTGVAVVPVPPAQVGDVFVATDTGDVVRMSSDGGDRVTLASGIGQLTDVVVDDEGNAYASSRSGTVWKLPADGSGAVGYIDAGASPITALAIGPDDSLYLAKNPGGVRHYDADLDVTVPVADNGSDLAGLAVDAAGVVHATTGGSLLEADGDSFDQLPADLAAARGMTWDPTGRRVLIAHTGNNQLVELPDGDPVDITGIAWVAGITDVSVAGDGRLWATAGDRVVTLDADGSDETTVADVAGAIGVDTWVPHPSFQDGHSGPVTGTGNVGTAYSWSSFAADANGGGPVTFSLHSGALPDPLALDATTGAITGTPTTPGTYKFRVLAANKARAIVSDEQTIVILKRIQTIHFTSALPPSGSRKPDGSYTPTVTPGDSTSPVVLSTADGDVCTYDAGTGKVTFHIAGTCVVQADQAADDHYEAAATATQTIMITRLSQTPPSYTEALPTDAKVGGTYTPTAAVSGSGTSLPVEFATTSVFPAFFPACEYDSATGKITYTHVGTCKIEAIRPGDDRYNPAYSSFRSFPVAAGDFTFGDDVPTEVHVGDTWVPTSNDPDGGFYTLTDYSICETTYLPPDYDVLTVVFHGPGVCDLVAYPATEDFAPSELHAEITVLKAGQTITFDDAPTGAVVGDSYTPSATGGASGNVVTYAIADGSDDVCSIDDADLVTFEHAGSCVVRADQEGDDNHGAGTATQTVVVGKAPQTIDFPTTGPTIEVGYTYAPSATADSGGDVAFTLTDDDDGACVAQAGGFALRHVGTCTIRATQPGTDDYLAADPVDQVFTVSQGTPTLTFSSSPGTKHVGETYDVAIDTNADTSPTYAVADSAVDVCSMADADTVRMDHVGTCRVDATVGGDADWSEVSDHQSFDVDKGSQAITFTSVAPSSPAVGSTYTPTAAATSGGPVTFGIAPASSACSITGGTVTFTDAGTCVVQAHQAGTADYHAAPTAEQTIGVGRLDQEITFVSMPPLGAVPGGTYDVVATSTSGGTVTFSIAPASAAVCSVTGATVHFDHAGSCDVVAEQSGSDVWRPASATQSVAVGKRATTLALEVRPTAMVATLTTAVGTPTGSVEFSDGGVTLGTAPLVAQDGHLVATLDQARPVGGSHEIVATYAGAGDFAGSEDSLAWTDPTITASVTSTGEESDFGWYRAPVTVTFTCTPGTAPLVGDCPPPKVIERSRRGAPIVRTISAEDGGSAQVTVEDLRIDLVAPKLRVKGARDGRTYGSRHDLTCKARDGLSGLDRCSVSQKRKAHGHTFVYRAVAWDRAGNRTVRHGKYHVR